MSHPLDPACVFDRFVVGPANRVATGAALRAAESPGRSYNPLVISGPGGVGKSHLLMAIGQRARALDPELLVHYETGDSFVDRLTRSLASGSVDAFREAAAGTDVLLLDGLQQVAGTGRTQVELLRVIDDLVSRGAQLVIASNAPPADIAGLDAGLVSRLAGGLNVEMTAPEDATRRAILARMVGDGGYRIDEEVLTAIAALPVRSVRELQNAFSRVVASAELAGREATLDDVAALRSSALDEPPPPDEFDAFLSDISTAVAAVVETAPWRRRLAEAILRWEGEGIRTRRLEAALDADSAPDVEALLTSFGRDVGRLRHIARELPPNAVADALLLRDPDRLQEAERLLAESKAARTDAAHTGGAGSAVDAAAGGRPTLPLAAAAVDRWFLDREKMAWEWLALDDRMVEEQR
ncbi:MAG TPA: DnaA/Hda family protein [Longimicrobium sp.]|nr:DnaA/Hda family protein [Longimicrobium sp.]